MTLDAQRTLIAGALVAALVTIAVTLLLIGWATGNIPIMMSGVSTIIGGLLTALNTPSGSHTADTVKPGTVLTTADPTVPTTTTTETHP